jgi:uncharacterized membrane protein YidH (DUF202 family)
MNRLHQFVLIVATIALAWLVMQAVHELGHVLGAILTGGKIAEVRLHLATISYTRVSENPNPLLVAWMGPLVGVSLPLLALGMLRWARLPGWYLLQFFAGFCLVANGAYLGFGSFGQIGDAGDLLRHGTPMTLLWLFGLTTMPLGFWLWNGLGPHFGLGAGRGQVSPIAAYVTLGLLIVVVAVELAAN